MIHHGDLFAVLPTLADASIDACVTDPPYGIGFMGREWDTFKPETVRQNVESKRRKHTAPPPGHGKIHADAHVKYDYSTVGLRGFQDWTGRWAVEVLRVLKPGAYIVVCGAPRSHHRMMCGLEDAGFVVRDCFAWLFGSGFPKNRDLGDGRGTALKPAHEPIALAWKPFKGSIGGNVERFGTGALNIESCRLDGTPSEIEMGRWPANVLLDEAAAALLDEQTGELVSGPNPTRRSADKFRETYGAFKGQDACEPARGLDVGGASRFYYVAKPSREERDMGCYDLLPQQRDDSRKEGHPGGDNPRNRGLQPRGNFHPTVKPIELMRWLVRLVTPPGGVVLDPFTGSGTTGIACVYESRQFIGIEREAEYVAIATRRIHEAAPLFSAEQPA